MQRIVFRWALMNFDELLLQIYGLSLINLKRIRGSLVSVAEKALQKLILFYSLSLCSYFITLLEA